MRGTLLSFIGLAIASHADAQERTRVVATLDWEQVSIKVSASSERGVMIWAVSGGDRVLNYYRFDEIKAWADSAAHLVSAILAAAPGEEVEYRTEFLLERGGEGGSVALSRTVGGKGLPFFVYISDEHRINTVTRSVGRVRAQAFVDALRRASATAFRMATRADSPWVGSTVGNEYYRVGCPAADSIPQEFRMYFLTEMEARQSRYVRSKDRGC